MKVSSVERRLAGVILARHLPRSGGVGKKPNTITITLKLDYLPYWKAMLKLKKLARDGRLRGCKLPKKLWRIKADNATTRTGKLWVRLYPSDALLRFIARLS